MCCLELVHDRALDLGQVQGHACIVQAIGDQLQAFEGAGINVIYRRTLQHHMAQFALMGDGGIDAVFQIAGIGKEQAAVHAQAEQRRMGRHAVAQHIAEMLGLRHPPDNGGVLVVPWLFEFGFWMAIVIGILFLGLYSHRVAMEIRSMSDALLATQMALAREQKLTDLGGVVAAAAHELGTPLATIKLVSAELMDELRDRPDLLEDAKLIRDQADRCRDILRDMGRVGKDDLHLRQAPLGAALREAAEPHMAREVLLNAKLRRTGICGATESLLIDAEVAAEEKATDGPPRVQKED